MPSETADAEILGHCCSVGVGGWRLGWGSSHDKHSAIFEEETTAGFD